MKAYSKLLQASLQITHLLTFKRHGLNLDETDRKLYQPCPGDGPRQRTNEYGTIYFCRNEQACKGK